MEYNRAISKFWSPIIVCAGPTVIQNHWVSFHTWSSPMRQKEVHYLNQIFSSATCYITSSSSEFFRCLKGSAVKKNFCPQERKLCVFLHGRWNQCDKTQKKSENSWCWDYFFTTLCSLMCLCAKAFHVVSMERWCCQIRELCKIWRAHFFIQQLTLAKQLLLVRLGILNYPGWVETFNQ